MTKTAELGLAARIALIGAWVACLAAVAGCGPSTDPSKLPEADVPGPSAAWREKSERISERPEIDRLTFARSGEPIAVFFQRNRVRDEDLAALSDLSTLRWLDLVDTGITDAGLVHLAKLPKLQTVYLNNIQVGDAGVAHLAELAELEMLHLGRTKITDAALTSLVKLPKLRELHLERTQVTDNGILLLKDAPTLEELFLTGTQATEAGVARLKEARPKLVVSFNPHPPKEEGSGEPAEKSPPEKKPADVIEVEPPPEIILGK